MSMHYTLYNKIKTALLLLTAFFYTSFLFSQTQPQPTKKTKYICKLYGPPVDTICGGYIESLPADYASNPTKKYPLILFAHGSGATGKGSQADLEKIFTENGSSLMKLIKNNKFPASFNVDNQDFSFIVIAPQFKDARAGNYIIKAMIDTCKALYRVDTSRIYVTGLSLGGANTNSYVSGWGDVTQIDRTAAALLICPSDVVPGGSFSFTTRGSNITTSNLPIWITGGTADGSLFPPTGNVPLYIDTINLFKPIPRAKLTLFSGVGHDAWTRTYNPDSTWDGLNVYQWMLQYTNKKLVANAGLDQAISFPGNSTITLNGTKSTARQGRISAWLWTKISGPTAGTITQSTDSITTVTGIDTGAYRFELKVTHTDASTARDTVLVSTQTQTKITKQIYKLSVPDTVVIGGYLQSLPVNYDIDTAKKYPLLVFLHAVEEMGNGSQAKLDTVTKRGIPKLIREGKFPASLKVNGKDFSFIVISPQFNTAAASPTAIKAMIDTCRKLYRVDTTRIYVTGMSQGGIMGWSYVGDVGASKTAAALLVRPTFGTPLVMGSGRVANVATNNLPMWVSSNYGDPVSYTSRANMKLFVDSINTLPAAGPHPTPATILTILDTAAAASTDAWTKTYNPLTKFWVIGDSLNVYQWMLNNTRPQPSPRKSQPMVDTVLVKEDDTKMLDAVLNPNPVRSNVTIWITGKAKGKSSITLYSLQGQRLSQQQFIKNTDEKMSRTINVSRFSGGTYVVQVIVGNKHKRVLQFIKL